MYANEASGGSWLVCFRFHVVKFLCISGLDKLVETIIATAEMQAPVCDPEMQVQGFILESWTEKGWGSMASMIIKQGTLETGNVCNMYSF